MRFLKIGLGFAGYIRINMTSLMSHNRLQLLKNRIRRADNSRAGTAAKSAAFSELLQWQRRLQAFADLNTDTEPAKACRLQIGELNQFFVEYKLL